MSEQALRINLKKLTDALINGLNKSTNEKWKVAIIKSNLYIQSNSDNDVGYDELHLVAVIKEDAQINNITYYNKIGTEVIPLQLLKNSRNWEDTKKDIFNKNPFKRDYEDCKSPYGFKLYELFNIKTNKYQHIYNLAKEEIVAVIKEEKKQERIRAIVEKNERIEEAKETISQAQEKIKNEKNIIKKLEQEIENYKIIKDEEIEA
ncbi:MAG: hypothetical protein CVV59_01065 [Tenericutes bacterium HGW-Tenericutes-4]|nr:MAG: hypothetical protein CVV59_01065 [Tenericutes bacterium HGW-Tenericutes-4]